MLTTKNIFFLTLTLSTLFLSAHCTATITEEEMVLVLTDENFNEAITAHPKLLVEFYAPWCGHCKSLAPEYAAAAKTLREMETPMYIAKVDATVAKKVAEKYEVQGFPTLKYFVNGTPVEYNGGRTADEIVSWLQKKSGPVITAVTKVSEVEDAKKSGLVVVYFDNKDGASYKAYEEIAMNTDDFSFLYTDSADVISHFSATKEQIVIFKNFDEKRNDYSGEIKFEAIKSWLDDKSIPTVMAFDEKAAEIIFGRSKTGIFLYRDAKKHANLDVIIREVATKYKGKLLTIATGIEQEMEEKLAEYIGITASDLPTVRIHEVHEEGVKKYSLKGEINLENINFFVDEYLAGKLVSELKSEEIPEANSNEHVRTLVGKNFGSVVNDSTKDILVEFYAPWCGHCKSLAPKYENLANALKSYENLVIAKMDSTANEVEGLEIEGFPTLKFYPAGSDKKPVDFEGDRTEIGILEFLKKNCKNNTIGEVEMTPLKDEEPAEGAEGGEGEGDMPEGEEPVNDGGEEGHDHEYEHEHDHEETKEDL